MRREAAADQETAEDQAALAAAALAMEALPCRACDRNADAQMSSEKARPCISLLGQVSDALK